MVTDKQVRSLIREMNKGRSLVTATIKAGMSEKTARKYIRSGGQPSEMSRPHDWRMREDPFEEVWEEVRSRLRGEERFEAKTLFEDLQMRYPGKFQDGQLKTLQRRVKRWRAEEGPSKEVFFPQEHHPGVLSESDFTRMGSLGIIHRGCSL